MKKLFALLALAALAIAPIASAADNLKDGNVKQTGQARLDATVRATNIGSGVFVPHQIPQPRTVAAADIHAPSSNTAAVVTYSAGGSGISHVITGVAYSYAGGTPTGGNLKIEDGSGTTVYTQDITAAGPGVVYFHVPKRGTANTALIVTLAAGGSGVSGKVSVLSHYTEQQ